MFPNSEKTAINSPAIGHLNVWLLVQNQSFEFASNIFLLSSNHLQIKFSYHANQMKLCFSMICKVNGIEKNKTKVKYHNLK